MKKKALNAETMKYSNYRRLIEELRIESISRSELARRMGLTRAAISLQVDALLNQGLLVEGSSIALKSSGRSSIALKLNGSACYCVGVAIRRDYFAAGLFDFCGNELACEHVDLVAPYDTRETAYAKLFSMIDNAIAQVKPAGTFIGIGVGAPGPINVEAGTIDDPPNLIAFEHSPVVSLLSERYHCPVTLKNDACTHALSELFYGVKDRYDSFLVLEVTGGLGGGLVLNRHLNESQLGNGSELGHTTIDINGKRCKCGNIGCAELYATLASITAYAMTIDSRFTNWRTIVDFANDGMPEARQVVEREAFYLTTLIVNTINMLDVEAIIVNGRDITYRPELLLSCIRRLLSERKLIKCGHPVDIITSSIDKNPDLLSAANLAIDRFLSSPEQLKRFGEAQRAAN
ncbi:MAG: ROK family transcriptional regulator [Clostridia bacterium]|nr:ROK family transcriptional regulator [Clostridia bacterium]